MACAARAPLPCAALRRASCFWWRSHCRVRAPPPHPPTQPPTTTPPPPHPPTPGRPCRRLPLDERPGGQVQGGRQVVQDDARQAAPVPHERHLQGLGLPRCRLHRHLPLLLPARPVHRGRRHAQAPLHCQAELRHAVRMRRRRGECTVPCALRCGALCYAAGTQCQPVCIGMQGAGASCLQLTSCASASAGLRRLSAPPVQACNRSTKKCEEASSQGPAWIRQTRATTYARALKARLVRGHAQA